MTEFSCDASMSCIVAAATVLSSAVRRHENLAVIILLDFIVPNMGDLCCVGA